MTCLPSSSASTFVRGICAAPFALMPTRFVSSSSSAPVPTQSQPPANVAKKSATEKALDFVSEATRIRLGDLRDNPGARTMPRQVSTAHNQAGHTIGELQRAAKPPLGWIWGNFYRPWQRMFPGEKHFNGDINLRREYVPLSLLELQRMIDLGYLDTSKLIDVCALCATQLVEVRTEIRQFGIHLTDEGSEIFAAKVNLEVQWASMTTIAAVEKAGGRIRTAYYDLNSLRAASDAEKWFVSGAPVPPRKYPPHSLLNYYTNPNYRGYLADEAAMEKSAKRMAKILGYDPPAVGEAETAHWRAEQKRPTQTFLGLEPGALVSLADKKVFEPTHPTLVDFYNPAEPLSDHLR